MVGWMELLIALCYLKKKRKKKKEETDFVIAAVFVVISTVLWCTFLAVNLARIEAQVPNLRVVLHFQSLVRRQSRAIQPQRLCKFTLITKNDNKNLI